MYFMVLVHYLKIFSGLEKRIYIKGLTQKMESVCKWSNYCVHLLNRRLLCFSEGFLIVLQCVV